MPTRAWFPTFIYHERLTGRGLARFNTELAEECRNLRDYDTAGRRWSAKNYPGGYTSYASLNQLHKFSSTFAGLERKLTAHVRRYAAQLDMDLRGRTVQLTDLWVNIMPEHAAHSLHLHPLSFISGTYYAVTPRGCPGLKFEDPRLSRFMAAPPKTAGVRPANRPHITYPAKAATSFCLKAGSAMRSPPTGRKPSGSASVLTTIGASGRAGPVANAGGTPAVPE